MTTRTDVTASTHGLKERLKPRLQRVARAEFEGLSTASASGETDRACNELYTYALSSMNEVGVVVRW